MNEKITIRRAQTVADFEEAKALIAAYVQWLGLDLSFQQLEEEMATLPEMYSALNGGLFVAYHFQQAVGVAGLRRFSASDAEVKRMFIQQGHRGMGIGQLLLTACIEAAKNLGYDCIKLDTLGTMKAAIQLYTANGFMEIPAYRHNPYEGAKYFELRLEH